MIKSMKTMITSGLAAAVVATSVLAAPALAQADSLTRADGSFEVAQNWNGNNRGHRGPGWNNGPARGPHWNRGGAWRGPGYYGNRYYDNSGAAVAAGVIGLATGAIIAGSMNNQPRYANNYVEYCSQRYRTFNPNTGTFTGNDGRQHRCVAPN